MFVFWGPGPEAIWLESVLLRGSFRIGPPSGLSAKNDFKPRMFKCLLCSLKKVGAYAVGVAHRITDVRILAFI